MTNKKDWVTFAPNKGIPIHNWFYFKEGYSKQLVDWLIDRYSLKGKILDPFSGTGTTILACKQRGIEAAGMDVSPLMVTVGNAKTRTYDVLKLKEQLEKIKHREGDFDKSLIDKRIRRLFYADVLEEILSLNAVIDGIKHPYHDFFLLALIDVAGRAANVVKVGRSLRKKKGEKKNVRKLFIQKCDQMIADVEKNPLPKTHSSIHRGDARTKLKYENTADAIITSPPYLNKFEYTKAYKLEIGLFYNYSHPHLKAFIGDSEKEDVQKTYFSDMKKVIKQMYGVLKKRGIACINVSGGCVKGIPVQTDEKIEEIAEKIGFKLKERIVIRDVWCHKNRSQKTGTVRESIVVLEK
jgi:DNA modification methylase